MAYSSNDLMNFYTYFKGNTTAYGVTQVGDIVDGKAEASSRLVHSKLTHSVMADHLNGATSIGVAPIDYDSTCFFGAIDIDNYAYNQNDIIRAIHDFNLPLLPCYSKSKKLHLYMFFSEPTNASEVKALLRWYADLFGCDKKTELFPKQDVADPKATFFSWINLPYFNEASDNHRKYIGADLQCKTLSEALSKIETIRMTLKEHKAAIDNFEYNDAPPCIASGIVLRDIPSGSRNSWLFSCGVYLRLKDENCDLEDKLKAINASLTHPIPEEELENTILRSFNKKSYFYMCSSMPRCDKATCRQREHGVESKASTGLDFGELTQYMTDPPYYEWIVNGKRMTFWSESEILQQRKFRELCLRQLHLVPRTVPDDRWAKILTRACENIRVVEDEQIEGDFTPGATFKGLLLEFFSERRHGTTLSTVFLGKVYKDTAKDEFIFTARAFTDFVVVKNGFTAFTAVEIQDRLKQMSAYKKENLWHIPCASVMSKQLEEDIDFKPTKASMKY